MNLSNELLLLSLTEFYTNKDNIDKMLNIINGQSKMSLRLIDWYITNYCKTNNEFIYCEKKKYEKPFINIYTSYRSQLKAYKKVKFDPFRRRERILFYYNNNNSYICTTIGQLNFFRWAIENDILNHIQKNLDKFESLMIFSHKKSKRIVNLTSEIKNVDVKEQDTNHNNSFEIIKNKIQVNFD